MTGIDRAVLGGVAAILATLHWAGAAEVRSPAPVGIFYSDVFLAHDSGKGHPESPARLQTILRAIQEGGLKDSLAWPAFAPATTSQVQMVHTATYVESVRLDVESGKRQLKTGDTNISSNTWAAARLAAGAGISAADGVMTGALSSAFCLVRPPGHHATPDRGMGFCVFNNVAIAARHLQQAYGVRRVLIADFDVHHGNGTQDIFYEDDTVFYFSVHQKGIYPGSGHADETGKGRGAGFTLNVERGEGGDDAQALAAFRDKLKPAMDKFKPEFILVSAGFDAHKDDPLGGLGYTEAGYASLARELVALADTYARGRIVFMLEGGYGLPGLSGSVMEILKVLQKRGEQGK